MVGISKAAGWILPRHIYAANLKDATRYPDKPVMLTEFGADTIAGFHDSIPVMFTEEYQAEFLNAYHEVMDEFRRLSVSMYGTLQILLHQDNESGRQQKGVFTRIESLNWQPISCEKMEPYTQFGYKHGIMIIADIIVVIFIQRATTYAKIIYKEQK